jgi:hypothetical protein
MPIRIEGCEPVPPGLIDKNRMHLLADFLQNTEGQKTILSAAGKHSVSFGVNIPGNGLPLAPQNHGASFVRRLHKSDFSTEVTSPLYRSHPACWSAKKGVRFKELVHEDFTCGALGHLQKEMPVVSLEPSMKNHLIAEKPIVQGDLSGQ